MPNIQPTDYLIAELKKNPSDYQMIIYQARADDEPDTDDMLYLFLSNYKGNNQTVIHWASKWDFLISYLYLNR